MCLSVSQGPVGRHSSWGHSVDPCACRYRCSWVPVGSHPPVPGENISPPSTCPSCLSMPGQWGRGPAPRSPVLTPSRILGLMSCKMRRLQLTRTDGARTRLLAQHAPSSTRRIFLQTFHSCSSRMLPHGVLSIPGTVEKAKHSTHHFLASQVVRNGGQGLILVLHIFEEDECSQCRVWIAL